MSTTTLDFRRPLGRGVLLGLAHVGRLSLMVAEMGRALSEWRVWLPLTITEAWNIGVGSLPIILLVAGFAGAVTALQTGYQFTGNIPYYVAGSLIVESVILELGPVLTGLILAGRIGARYAAELGTMRVTEQIDALTTLSTNPYKYLVVPRLIAAVITLPILVLLADIIGVLGGFLVGVYKLDFNDAAYLRNTLDFLQFQDVFSGLVKAAVFGFLIALMGCYHGYTSKGGAQGVGMATTSAVVSASMLILTFNYFITEAFFAL
jgi:phospholipid/cholesterol/gamma-HCH transport system permease protein